MRRDHCRARNGLIRSASRSWFVTRPSSMPAVSISPTATVDAIVTPWCATAMIDKLFGWGHSGAIVDLFCWPRERRQRWTISNSFASIVRKNRRPPLSHNKINQPRAVPKWFSRL
jgi:hypothetical protein